MMQGLIYNDKKEHIIFTKKYYKEYKEINISFFWDRLLLLLNVDLIWSPKLLLFTNTDNWLDFIELDKKDKTVAVYNESKNAIGFNINSFKYKTRYAISYDYIYHELIHAIQFLSGKWINWQDNFIEGSADLLSNFLIKHPHKVQYNDILVSLNYNIQYSTEAINIWFLCRKIFKFTHIQFFMFLRDYICNDNFFNSYFSNNTIFLKYLKRSKDFNSNIIEFFEKINNKNLFNTNYKLSNEHEMIKDIFIIRNILLGIKHDK